MNQKQEEELSMEEAIIHWFQTVYLPLVCIIRDKKILRHFPGRILADMYVWIVRYWDDLKHQFGENIPMTEAVTDFNLHYRFTLKKRIINSFKKIVLRREIDSLRNEP